MLPAEGEELELLRLLIEEVCCDLCRFQHVDQGGGAASRVRIRREFPLGPPGAYAGALVVPPASPPFYLEVKLGYSRERLLALLKRKYGEGSAAAERCRRVLLVVDAQRLGASLEDELRAILGGSDASLEGQLRAVIDPRLSLEVWDEARLAALVKESFGVELGSLGHDEAGRLRPAIEAAKAKHAFGREGAPSPLEQSLMWHFGCWQLGRLRRLGRLQPERLMAPGTYRGVTVLLADLCSFSSYVRDTREDAVVRNCLTSFYSKARSAVLDAGGVFYQFVGDEAIALFGVGDAEGGAKGALECAEALVDIGQSVSLRWQRHIDRVQKTSGAHVGIGVGDLQIVPLRPYSQSQWSVIGDAINLGSRLMGVAGPGEIVVSNAFYQQLPEPAQASFGEMQDLDAKNVGSLRAWKRNGATH